MRGAGQALGPGNHGGFAPTGGGEFGIFELVRRLAGVPAADVPAVRVVLELRAETEIEKILERQAEIDEALKELEWQVREARGIGERCQRLAAVPSRRVPTGF